MGTFEASILITARSVGGSEPMMIPSNTRPSKSVTWTFVEFSITWLLVIINPFWSKITPDPCPPGTTCSLKKKSSVILSVVIDTTAGATLFATWEIGGRLYDFSYEWSVLDDSSDVVLVSVWFEFLSETGVSRPRGDSSSIGPIWHPGIEIDRSIAITVVKTERNHFCRMTLPRKNMIRNFHKMQSIWSVGFMFIGANSTTHLRQGRPLVPRHGDRSKKC